MSSLPVTSGRQGARPLGSLQLSLAVGILPAVWFYSQGGNLYSTHGDSSSNRKSEWKPVSKTRFMNGRRIM